MNNEVKLILKKNPLVFFSEVLRFFSREKAFSGRVNVIEKFKALYLYDCTYPPLTTKENLA